MSATDETLRICLLVEASLTINFLFEFFYRLSDV